MVFPTGVRQAQLSPFRPRTFQTGDEGMSKTLSIFFSSFGTIQGSKMMQKKPNVKELGTAAVTTLHLTEHFQGSSQIVMAGNLFGSVESVKTLMQKGF